MDYFGQETFAEWLNREVARKGLTLKALARLSGVSYVNLWRLASGRDIGKSGKLRKATRRPQKTTVEKIGRALNAQREALWAAGFSTDFPMLLPENLKKPQSYRESLELFLTFLKHYRQVPLIASQIEYLFELILNRSVSNQAQLLQNARVFARQFGDTLSPYAEVSRENIRAKVSDIIINFMDCSPIWEAEDRVQQIFDTKEIKLLQAKEIIIAHESASYKFSSPLATFPLAILKLGIDFREMLQADRDPVVLLAKCLAQNWWGKLPAPFFLVNATEYYSDLRFFYQGPGSSVINFSTTPGLLLPYEYYGSFLKQNRILTRDLYKTKKPNPWRLTYFEHGMLHGCLWGGKVYYQFDLPNCAQVWNLHLTCLTKTEQSLYKDLAIENLAKFLKTGNVILRAGNLQTRPESIPEYLDCREWLTLTRNDATLITNRSRERHLVHGAIIHSNIIDEFLPPSVRAYIADQADTNGGYIYRLARLLFERGEYDSKVNDLCRGYAPKTAEQSAKEIIEEIIRFGRSL